MITPALRAQALEGIKKYTIRPLYTPPSLSNVPDDIKNAQLIAYALR
jgi:hypothetical protein